MTRPLGDAAEDAERWWQAYQLAENDQAGELRERANAGDEHARRQLASWLADRGYTGGLPDRAKLDEAIEVIRPLADAGDDVAELWLARRIGFDKHLTMPHPQGGRGQQPAPVWLAVWLALQQELHELPEHGV